MPPEIARCHQTGLDNTTPRKGILVYSIFQPDICRLSLSLSQCQNSFRSILLPAIQVFRVPVAFWGDVPKQSFDLLRKLVKRQDRTESVTYRSNFPTEHFDALETPMYLYLFNLPY